MNGYARAAMLGLWLAGCFGDGRAGPADAGRDGGRAAASLRDAGPPPPTEPPFDAGDAPLQAELGVAGGEAGVGFSPLPEAGPIPIGGVGQAGLTARMAVRLRDPSGGSLPDSAIIELVLINAETGVVAESKPWGIPVELECSGDVCDQPRVLVEITHLAKLPELPGLQVWIQLTVRDAADPERVLARTRGSGRLTRT